MLRMVALYAFLTTLSFPLSAKQDSDASTFILSALEQKTEVVRDANGIAHIFAKNEHDLFFMQGFIHAQDRLFQMDLARRRASGTMAELLGSAALESDVLFRTIGLRRAAERSLPIFSNRAKRAITAYTKGINAYVAQHPLPPEYAALEVTQFTPWTETDVVVVSKLLTFSLSFDVLDIDRTIALQSYQEAGTLLGFNGEALFFEDLFRSQAFDLLATVPDAQQSPANSTSVDDEIKKLKSIDPVAAELCKKASKKIRKIPYMQRLMDGDKPQGSNEWAISGEYTQSGFPLIANDPHLQLGVPSTFYPIHLKAGKIDVIGSGFAGVPTVVVGHNRHIAWGTTFNQLDVVDIFQEQVIPDASSPSGLSTLYQGSPEHVIPIPEVFRLNQVEDGVSDNIVVVPPGNGVPAVTLIVPRRNQGPIIEFDQQTGIALSVQYTGFSGTREIDSFLSIDSARNLDDFIAALQLFDVGSENFAYADKKGNIAYFTSAEMPLREDLQVSTVNGLPPYFIRNGQGGNEWLAVKTPPPSQAVPYEILPFNEMPQIINPTRGWFINANHDPAGVTLDNNPLNQLRANGGIFYLHYSFQSTYRADRLSQLIRQRLETNNRKLTFEDMQTMQADTVLRDAQVLTPYILQAFENAKQADSHPLLAGIANNLHLAEAVQRLSQWDHSTPTGIPEGYDASDHNGTLGEPDDAEIAASIAATIYSVWRSQFVYNVIDNKLQPFGLPVPDGRQTLAALRNLLDNFDTNQGQGASGVDFFAVPEVDDADHRRDIIILKSLSDALTLLASEAFAPAFNYSTEQDDYRWGRLHRVVFEHPLDGPFSIPPAGGAFPPPLSDLSGIPTDGGFQVIDASSHSVRAQSANDFMFTAGPVNRFVATLEEEGRIKAEAIWPGGTSGVVGNPNYVNMLPLWLSNETIPLATKNNKIKEDAQNRTVFKPHRNLDKQFDLIPN